MSGRNSFPPKPKDKTSEIIQIVQDHDGPGSGIDADTLNGKHIQDLVVTNDLSNQSQADSIVVSGDFINQPSIINILDGDIDVQDAFLIASDYSTNDTYIGPHTSSSWQISTREDMANPIVQIDKSNINLIALNIEDLDGGIKYYARVRYHSDYVMSDWSDVVSFTTMEEPHIKPPVITINGYPDNVFTSSLVKLSGFEVVGDTDTLVRTTIWIKDSNDNNIYTGSKTNEEDLFVYDLSDTNIVKDEEYTLVAVFEGEKYTSETTTITFKATQDYGIIPPGMTVKDTTNEVSTLPIIDLGAYIVAGISEEHMFTDIEIIDTNGNVLVSDTLDVLAQSGTYYPVPNGILSINLDYRVKARFRSNTVTSEWSELPITPTYIHDMDRQHLSVNSIDQEYLSGHITMELLVNGVIAPGTEVYSYFEVYDESTRELIIERHSYANDGGFPYPQIFELPEIKLGVGYTFLGYTVVDGKISAYSINYLKTSNENPLVTPILNVDLPNDNGTRSDLIVSASGSAFTINNPSPVVFIEHETSDWVLVDNANNVHWKSEGDTVNLTSIAIPYGVTLPDTVYTLSVRYGSRGLYSEYAEMEFTTVKGPQVKVSRVNALESVLKAEQAYILETLCVTRIKDNKFLFGGASVSGLMFNIVDMDDFSLSRVHLPWDGASNPIILSVDMVSEDIVLFTGWYQKTGTDYPIVFGVYDTSNGDYNYALTPGFEYGTQVKNVSLLGPGVTVNNAVRVNATISKTAISGMTNPILVTGSLTLNDMNNGVPADITVLDFDDTLMTIINANPYTGSHGNATWHYGVSCITDTYKSKIIAGGRSTYLNPSYTHFLTKVLSTYSYGSDADLPYGVAGCGVALLGDDTIIIAGGIKYDTSNGLLVYNDDVYSIKLPTDNVYGEPFGPVTVLPGVIMPQFYEKSIADLFSDLQVNIGGINMCAKYTGFTDDQGRAYMISCGGTDGNNGPDNVLVYRYTI